MKVLLVNPPQEYLDTYNEASKKVAWLVAPLGLAYIAAVLERNNIGVRIYDGQIQEKLHFTELNTILKEMKPDVVGIATSTPTLPRAIQTAENIRAQLKIPIVIGGPHINVLAAETLREHKCFDFAVFGEGEFTMLELVKTIENKQSFSEVKGLAYRERD